jgi:hypothetical protein
MAEHGFFSQVHRKQPQGRPMAETTRRAHGRKSAVPAQVDHVFAEQKDRIDPFIRTTGLAWATNRIGLAHLVDIMKWLIRLQRIATA